MLEEGLQVPESPQNQYALPKKPDRSPPEPSTARLTKFDSFIDAFANYFECVRIFENQRLESILQNQRSLPHSFERGVSSKGKLEGSSGKKNGKKQDCPEEMGGKEGLVFYDTKYGVAEKESNRSSSDSEAETDFYPEYDRGDDALHEKIAAADGKHQRELIIRDFEELPFSNGFKGCKVVKKYTEDFDITESERNRKFCSSLEYVRQLNQAQEKLYEKNCWAEFKRWVCCRGGNQIDLPEEQPHAHHTSCSSQCSEPGSEPKLTSRSAKIRSTGDSKPIQDHNIHPEKGSAGIDQIEVIQLQRNLECRMGVEAQENSDDPKDISSVQFRIDEARRADPQGKLGASNAPEPGPQINLPAKGHKVQETAGRISKISRPNPKKRRPITVAAAEESYAERTRPENFTKDADLSRQAEIEIPSRAPDEGSKPCQELARREDQQLVTQVLAGTCASSALKVKNKQKKEKFIDSNAVEELQAVEFEENLEGDFEGDFQEFPKANSQKKKTRKTNVSVLYSSELQYSATASLHSGPQGAPGKRHNATVEIQEHLTSEKGGAVKKKRRDLRSKLQEMEIDAAIDVIEIAGI